MWHLRSVWIVVLLNKWWFSVRAYLIDKLSKILYAYRLFTSDIRYRNADRLRCPRILPGVATWFILAQGMQILHKLYTLDIGCRTCMRFSRRDVSRHAKHDGNRMPPSSFLLIRFRLLSFFLRLKYLVRWMTTLDVRVDMPVLER